jgi:hypothetical protein
LLPILSDVARADNRFSKYLLPSLMCVRFEPFVRHALLHSFGRDVASLPLFNADSASDMSPAVPAVSLRYVDTLEKNERHSIVRCLVSTMVFDVLDGSGKDFERAWALLAMCGLQLQFLVRSGAGRGIFWPTPAVAFSLAFRTAPQRARSMCLPLPTTLRRCLCSCVPNTFSRPHSTIHRMIQLSKAPTLAVWHDPWARTVTPGSKPPKWPDTIQCDVVWRSSTIVHFEMTNTAAIDFMLLVGDAGGVNERASHVYMLQCKAWQTRNMTQAHMVKIVTKLDNALKTLFSAPFALSNVLRKAGVHNARQVTLCVAAISFGSIDFAALAAPFNIVLFAASTFAQVWALLHQSAEPCHILKSKAYVACCLIHVLK